MAPSLQEISEQAKGLPDAEKSEPGRATLATIGCS